MDEFILRTLQGKADEAETRAFEEWRRAAPANEALYREWAALWLLAGVADRKGPLIDLPDLTPRLPVGLAVPRRTAVRRWAVRGSLAAAWATVLFGGWQAVSAATTQRLAVVEVSTGRNDHVTVALGDGSIVRLGASTRLDLPGAGREVRLDGQAFFGVARRANDSFVVRTRTGRVEVLGTRFEVLGGIESTRVLVVEGRVAFAAGDTAVQLIANQVGTAEGGGAPRVARIADPVPHLEWMGRALIFQNTPLPEAAREIERLYGGRVEVPDTTLAGRTVTAWFSGQSFSEVIRVMCRVVDARCTISDSRAVIVAE